MSPFPEACPMLTTELKGAGEAIFEKRNIDWLNYGILSEVFSELRVATIFFFGRTAGPMNSKSKG